MALEDNLSNLDKAALLTATNANERVILNKMGFTTMAQVEFFNEEQKRNPELKAMFSSYQGQMATNAKFDGVLKNVGSRLIREGAATNYQGNPGTVLDQLNQDLKNNPAGKSRLDALFKDGNAQQLNALAATIPAYKVGSLDQSLNAAAPAAQQQKPAAAAQPAKPAPAGGGRGNVNPPMAVPAEPPRPATPSAQTAAAPVTAPPAAAPAPATTPTQTTGATPSQAPAQAGAGVSVLGALATSSDQEIRDFLTPAKMPQIAKAIQEYSDKKYPDMAAQSKHYAETVAANPPGNPDNRGLQERMAENLQKNPQLIRDLAKTMNEPDDPNDPLADMKKSGIKKTLQDIYTQPENLAKKDYTDGLADKLKMANGAGGGLMGGLKGILGNDLGGMGGFLSKIGDFLKGIMKWFGNLFESFSSGNFAMAGNVDPKMSMWGRFSYAMDRAKMTDGLERHAQVIPRHDAKGPVGGNGQVLDAQGKPVMEDVHGRDGKLIGQRPKLDPEFDHRVEYGGQKFYLTNGIKPSKVMQTGSPTGYNHWYVATEVDAQGKPTNIKEIVLNDKDSKSLMDRLESETRAAGTSINFSKEVPETPSASFTQRYDVRTGRPVGVPLTPREMVASDPKLQVDGGAYTSPVRPQGPVTGRPLDPLNEQTLQPLGS